MFNSPSTAPPPRDRTHCTHFTDEGWVVEALPKISACGLGGGAGGSLNPADWPPTPWLEASLLLLHQLRKKGSVSSPGVIRPWGSFFPGPLSLGPPQEAHSHLLPVN